MDILKQLAEELHLEPRRVESVVALLDDGTPVRVKDFLGFAEKVENKW